MDDNNTNMPNEPVQPQQPASPPPQPQQPNFQQPIQPQQPMQQPMGQPQPQQPMNGQPYQEPSQSDTFGIISIVLAFFFPLAGLIVGFIGKSKAKKMGYSGKLSLIGIILNAVFMLIGVLVFVFLVLFSFQGAQTIARDTEAKTNVNSTFQKLEESYNDNGYYPEELSADNLKGIDPAIISDIKADSRYQYKPSGCVSNKCREYIIDYELESEDSFGNKVYQKESLNQ